MPITAALERLRLAIKAEQSTIGTQLARYLELMEKMNAYQTGRGPAPTGAEFEDWRQSVEVVKRLRELEVIRREAGREVSA